jgi:branched-chain amino acid aminotransferase
MKYYFLNDKIVPSGKALISIEDIGILRGYSVFDFLRTYNGKPFLLKEHLKRLRNSARLLSLSLPLPDEKIEKIIKDLLKKNKMKDVQVRILLTGGKVIDGMGFDPRHPTFAILIEELKLPQEELYRKGAKLITNIHFRHAHSAKTTNYINAIALTKERKKKNAIEVLYIYNDNVLECSTSNFFMFKKNTLITPKNNILPGTTRKFLLTLIAKDFHVKERDIHFQELQKADEAFITATNKEVLPIVQIDTLTIGTGKVGENTKKIMKKFADSVRNF